MTEKKPQETPSEGQPYVEGEGHLQATSAAEPPAPQTPPTYTGERAMGLKEFFQSHMREFSPHVLGAFVFEKEQAGELSGFDSKWLTELRAFVNRPVKR
jgi:hypothetical protein